MERTCITPYPITSCWQSRTIKGRNDGAIQAYTGNDGAIHALGGMMVVATRVICCNASEAPAIPSVVLLLKLLFI